MDLLSKNNVSASFNVTELSPFDICEDLMTNPFQESGNDKNQVAKAPQDPLSIHGGLVTRVRVKKMKEALNGLIEHVLNSCPVQDTILSKL